MAQKVSIVEKANDRRDCVPDHQWYSIALPQKRISSSREDSRREEGDNMPKFRSKNGLDDGSK